MSEVKLYNGDCLIEMDKIPDKSIDMILCDLPYGTTTCAWDIIIPFDDLWKQYNRIIKDNGAIVLFASQPFTSKLICSNIGMFKYSLVWNKNKCGSPGLAKIRPMKVHEDICIFCKSVEKYNPQMEKGEAYSRKFSGEQRCNNMGYGFAYSTNEYKNDGTRYPKSILNFSRNFSAQQQVHPTQKPVTLLEYLIKTYSNESDTILDNTMGSGSTGVACVNTNRNFIGIELNKEYFDIASNRISEAQNKQKEKLF
jgi:site-specific DNA-methyltransferase (adenine-specific)